MAKWHLRWRVWIALIISAGFGMGLLSVHETDPSLWNLATPRTGIQNWLGVFGAVVCGSWKEAFGWAAWWLPVGILYWGLPIVNTKGWRYWQWLLAAHLSSAFVLGILTTIPDQAMLGKGGWIGWSALGWIRYTGGNAIGLTFSGVLLFIACLHLLNLSQQWPLLWNLLWKYLSQYCIQTTSWLKKQWVPFIQRSDKNPDKNGEG